MIRPVPHLDAMAPYALADLGGAGTTSLAQNESAFPPSPAALDAGADALKDMRYYPDPDWTELRDAIAGVHALKPGNILCGAGSMELIGAVIHAYAGPRDEVLGTEFGYAFVASACAQAQTRYVTAPELALTVSVDHILDRVTAATKIVFLCNPGNPTGTAIPNQDILRLRDNLPGHVLLVVDQAYAEFTDAGQPPSDIFALTGRGDTIVTRTLSKAYGLAGARAGWGYFPADIARELRKLLNPNNISGPSQVMAAAAMRDQAHMRSVVAQTAGIRDRFARDCRALGYHVPRSHTNFVLIRFDGPDAARRADMALREAGLLMRGMAGYGLADCLRATICAQPVMDRVLSVLGKLRN